MKSYWDSHYRHLTEGVDFGPGSDLYRQYEYYLRLIGVPSTDAHIVDLGCSVGHFLQVWHDQGYRNLQGVDLDGHSVAIARQRQPETGFEDQLLHLFNRHVTDSVFSTGNQIPVEVTRLYCSTFTTFTCTNG